MSVRYALEGDFNRELSAALERRGAVVMAIVGSEMQGSGWPDRYVAHKKYHGWVEGKRDGRKLTTMQRHRMEQFEMRGVPALEVRYVSEVDEVRVATWDGHEILRMRHNWFMDDALDLLGKAAEVSLGRAAEALRLRREGR